MLSEIVLDVLKWINIWAPFLEFFVRSLASFKPVEENLFLDTRQVFSEHVGWEFKLFTYTLSDWSDYLIFGASKETR